MGESSKVADAGDMWVLARERLDECILETLADREIIAPVAVRDEVHFRPITRPRDVVWDYASTCLPASKAIYAPSQDLLRLTPDSGSWKTKQVEPEWRPRVLLGVHPCDVHGLLVLQRTLLGTHKDPWFEAARRATTIVALNCQHVGPTCFCASFGTGPFLHPWMGQGPPEGCDLLLTDLGARFLIEVFSEAGRALLPEKGLAPAGEGDLEEKRLREAEALDRFQKRLDTRHLPELLLRNLEHPVWERVAESRCLSCTNCTMVCPTCYCYDVADETAMDLTGGVRRRRWDSCQDQHFAEVHFGNYRGTRASRLRQFVCHKLSYWVEQHGCFGCVGCGRCMHWCPTHIDLADIAAEIREDEAQQ